MNTGNPYSTSTLPRLKYFQILKMMRLDLFQYEEYSWLTSSLTKTQEFFWIPILAGSLLVLTNLHKCRTLFCTYRENSECLSCLAFYNFSFTIFTMVTFAFTQFRIIYQKIIFVSKSHRSARLRSISIKKRPRFPRPQKNW